MAALAASHRRRRRPEADHHVYLAREAAGAADGRVTIELLGPHRRARRWASSRSTRADAIRQQPLAYFAGVLGPDATPTRSPGRCACIHPARALATPT
jgi:hypothetical protein